MLAMCVAKQKIEQAIIQRVAQTEQYCIRHFEEKNEALAHVGASRN